MPANRKEHLRYRYGICLNDSCQKCKSKEVQQIAARKDFVCEECQKPLRECPPPKSFWDKYGKMIIVAAVVVIAVTATSLFMLMPSESEEVVEDPAVVSVEPETDVNKPDSVPVIEPVPAEERDSTAQAEPAEAEAKPAESETAKEPVKKPVPKSAIQVPFGTYSGPANGLNGEIKVTRNYTLDLRNAAHESIELRPGDVITHTQFRNGTLVSGYWHRGSESRSFHR